MAGDATDGELIARSMANPESFAAIFDRHYDAVFRFAERRVGLEAARDVASEVFVVAFRMRERFDAGAESARPWLYGIASRKVLHEHRRFARQQAASPRVAHSPHVDETDVIAARLDADAEARTLLRALDALDPESREVLLMVTWDKLSYADAAAALDIPVGTVRSRVHRARKSLAAGAGFVDEESEVLR